MDSISAAGSVVIAEDSFVNREILKSILEEAGYEVRAATNGREALAMIEQRPPEVVLTDVQMPEVDGYAVCRAIKSSARLAAIPVIFVSANEATSEKVRGFEAGGVDYVTKPYEPAEVLARVSTQVKLFRAQRDLKQKNLELQRRNEQLILAHERTQAIFGALAEALPGTVLDDKYRLEQKIGEGGFGAVYRATHLQLDKSIAVKVLRPGDGSGEQIARFRREGIAACRVAHPNAIEVLDFGVSSSGIPYLVMELLRGRTLQSLMREATILPLDRSAAILTPVCAALEAAHAVGIVHRDVKPDNVFLHQGDSGEVVKVVDFGIAKLLDDPNPAGVEQLTQRGFVVGTPSYMAPERLFGSAHDERSDIYSVGVLAYTLLCGEMPLSVDEPSAGEMIKLHLTTKPKPLRDRNPDVPESIADVIMQALEYSPSGRPPLRAIADRLRTYA